MTKLYYGYLEDRLKDLHNLLEEYASGCPVTEGGADALIDKTQEVIRACGGSTPPAKQSTAEAAALVERMLALVKVAQDNPTITKGIDDALREHARRVSFHAANAIADAGTNFFRGFRPQRAGTRH